MNKKLVIVSRFNEDIEKVLKGKIVNKDTNKLKLPVIDNIDD